jgi:hypothetical protein
VRGGLAAFEGGPDWRGPVADRLYLPTADGGRAISDAVRETDFILEAAYALRSKQRTPPKGGARYHFSPPGSVQGFRALDDNLTLENTPHPMDPAMRVLTAGFRLTSNETSALTTPTFIPPEAIDMPGYGLIASPTLYPGQTVLASVLAGASNTNRIRVGLIIQWYGEADQLVSTQGPMSELEPGELASLNWQIPEVGGAAIAEVGVSIASDETVEGVLHLDRLSWDGPPHVKFHRPAASGRMWKRQWVNAADYFEDEFGEAFRVIQNRGRGLVITGTREWTEYSVQASLTPHLADAFGLAARVQGQERYYALLFSDRDKVRLIKRLDGETVLEERAFPWEFGKPYELKLEVQGNHIRSWVDGVELFSVEDALRPLSSGGIALACENGRIGTDEVLVLPGS